VKQRVDAGRCATAGIEVHRSAIERGIVLDIRRKNLLDLIVLRSVVIGDLVENGVGSPEAGLTFDRDLCAARAA